MSSDADKSEAAKRLAAALARCAAQLERGYSPQAVAQELRHHAELLTHPKTSLHTTARGR